MLQIECVSQILIRLLQGSQLPSPMAYLLSLMQNANMVADDLMVIGRGKFMYDLKFVEDSPSNFFLD